MVSLCGALEIFTLADFAVCAALLSAPACADKLSVSPEALAVADQIYSGDFEGWAAACASRTAATASSIFARSRRLWWKICDLRGIQVMG